MTSSAATKMKNTSASQLNLTDDVVNLLLPSSKSRGAESLPPIVPSIGITPGIAKQSAGTKAGEPSSDQTTTATDSKSPAQSTVAGDVSSTIPPTLKIGNRLILTSKPPRQWAWKSFTSSARHDQATFSHWVRANVEYADYPYARFDVHLDPVTYTDEEYKAYLSMDGAEELEKIFGEEVLEERMMATSTFGSEGSMYLVDPDAEEKDEHEDEEEKAGTKKKASENEKNKSKDASESSTSATPNLVDEDKSQIKSNRMQIIQNSVKSNKILPWTKEETDALMELCHSCDLRWPVIIDRWYSRFGGGVGKGHGVTVGSLRKVEDLQHRYYQVGSILSQKRMEAVMAAEVSKLSGEGGATGEGLRNVPNDLDLANTALGPAQPTVQNPAMPESGVPGNSVHQPQLVPPSHPPLHPVEIEALQATHQQTSIHPSLAPNLSIPSAGIAHRSKVFDLASERARRRQLEYVWNRSKEEEREEEELRAELRAVEAQLRKLKKMGKHLVPVGSAAAASETGDSTAAAVSGTGSSAGVSVGAAVPKVKASTAAGRAATKESHATHEEPASSNPINPPTPTNTRHSRSTTSHAIAPIDPYFYSKPEDFLDAAFNATAPQPTPGTPYLQSGRLFPPAIGGHSGLNKSTLKQMDAILTELGVPKDPIPTKRSCDLYDAVRKDTLTLLILQKMVLRKEAEVLSKRAKLIKLKGSEADTNAEKVVEEKQKPSKSKRSEVPHMENTGKAPANTTVTVPVPRENLIGESTAVTGAPGVETISEKPGGKKLSGTSSKSSKSSKRPREDSASSQMMQIRPGSAGVIVGGNVSISSGKKAPSASGTSRKKSRKSAAAPVPGSAVGFLPGGDSSVGGTQPVNAVGMPGIHPASQTKASKSSSISYAAALSGPIAPNSNTMPPIPTKTTGVPAAAPILKSASTQNTLAPNPNILPYSVPPAPSPRGKTVGKIARPPTKSSNPPAASNADASSLPRSATLYSPGKTTGKKRSKKSS